MPIELESSIETFLELTLVIAAPLLPLNELAKPHAVFSVSVLSALLGLNGPPLQCPLKQHGAKAERFGDYITPKTQNLHLLSAYRHHGIVAAIWPVGKKQPPSAFPVATLNFWFSAECCGALDDEVCAQSGVTESQCHLRAGFDLPNLSQSRVSADEENKLVEIADWLYQPRAWPTMFSSCDQEAILGTCGCNTCSVEAVFDT